MAEKKKNESAIVKATADLMTIPLTAENVLKFIEPKATLQEVALFLNQCAMFQLNPFKREIYLIKYSSNDPASFVVAYDVYLKRAERSGKWAGMKTGVIRDVEGQIIYGWAEVYRKDWTIPLRHEVAFGEYVAMRDEWKDGKRTGKKVPTRFWTEKPETMIKKVAVAQAFRMAFPDDRGYREGRGRRTPEARQGRVHGSREVPRERSPGPGEGTRDRVVARLPRRYRSPREEDLHAQGTRAPRGLDIRGD
jgi:phage recombination protein Bet